MQRTVSRQKVSGSGDILLIALIVGVLFTVLAIASSTAGWIDTAGGRILLSVGVGIVLGALGSTATIHYKNQVTVGGAAAIAIVIFVVLDNVSDERVVFGTLYHEDIESADVQIMGEETYMGATRTSGYHFLVKEPEKLNAISVSIQFDSQVDDTAPAGAVARDRLIKLRVHSSHVNDLFASGARADWAFNRNTNEILVGDTVIASYHLNHNPPRKNAIVASRPGWHFFSRAYAGGMPFDPQQSVEQLSSRSLSVRNIAEQKLRRGGVDSVPALLSAIRRDDERQSYFQTLSALTVLSDLLYEDISRRREVLAHISDSDIALLVDLLTNEDESVRFYSGQFLTYLNDPRAPLAIIDSLEEYKGRQSVAGEKNLVAVGVGLMPALSEEQRQMVSARFAAIEAELNAETRQLSDQFSASVPMRQLSGDYFGVWLSNKYSNRGALNIHFDVGDDGAVSASYKLTGSPVRDAGTLSGTMTAIADEPGAWHADLRGNGLTIQAKVTPLGIEGSYKLRFGWFNLLSDRGQWELDKKL